MKIKELEMGRPVELDADLVNCMRQQWYNYCEGILLKDGRFMLAIRGHVNTLIKLTGETEDAIWEKMPVTAAPIGWLTNYTGCIAINNNISVKGVKSILTAKQKVAFSKLVEAGLIMDNLVDCGE